MSGPAECACVGCSRLAAAADVADELAGYLLCRRCRGTGRSLLEINGIPHVVGPGLAVRVPCAEAATRVLFT